ncbi:molybdenum cofactor guanylyltransferase [Bacillus sp. AFS041924]|uniref:molybdenum cofactor guanylyltransferase n=1 Tax=Bacillus sp. AFS041924 TaxID=2033503 RepID=UPI000BFB397D|nr:molybdenum cofactor guanylyltransferase [Bacillus sp. AFS041924]PGS48465.1 molybdenum cofactor guanylyltransferase [Bacillus sp. AFS041924]
MKIAGVVLAGGKSSRYGKPKMFETYKNKFLYEYSVEALKENSISPIIISTNEKLVPYFSKKDLDFVIEGEADEYQGPLYAMYNAFSKRSNTDWYFVLACDTPFITADFVKKMIAKVKHTNVDAIVPVQSDKLQPLFALYHRNCIGKMKEIVDKNNRKLQLLFDEVNLFTVPFSKDELIFKNINRPEDWQNGQE